MEPYTILYEDEDLLVANKLTPIPIQRERSGDRSLQELLRSAADGAATAQASSLLEAVHRIDRRASGAAIFAKTRKALVTLEAAFRDRRVEKEYLACVEREPAASSGRLVHRLIWDKRRNVVRALPAEAAENAASESTGRRGAEGGKSGAKAGAQPLAILDYRVVGRSERYWFVAVQLITGRHHQIRAQLASLGCPIRGDLKYGARRSSPSGLIMLHARRLAFDQPRTGARVEVVAPFPPTEPLWSAFEPDQASASEPVDDR